jgi:hypothetical protein
LERIAATVPLNSGNRFAATCTILANHIEWPDLAGFNGLTGLTGLTESDDTVQERTRHYLELSWKSTTCVRREESRRGKHAGSTRLLILISIIAIRIHG